MLCSVVISRSLDLHKLMGQWVIRVNIFNPKRMEMIELSREKTFKFIGFAHNVGKNFAVLLNKNKNCFSVLKLRSREIIKILRKPGSVLPQKFRRLRYVTDILLKACIILKNYSGTIGKSMKSFHFERVTYGITLSRVFSKSYYANNTFTSIQCSH